MDSNPFRLLSINMQFKTLQRLASFWILKRAPNTIRFVFLCLQPRKEGAFVFGWRQQNSRGAKLKVQTGSIIQCTKEHLQRCWVCVTLQNYLSHRSFSCFTFFQLQPMKRKTAFQQKITNSNPPGTIKLSTQSETWSSQKTRIWTVPGLLQGSESSAFCPRS